MRMTRTYAAKRLLEHGPLTCAEFTAITGWAGRRASKTLRNLTGCGIATAKNIDGRRHYLLTETHQSTTGDTTP